MQRRRRLISGFIIVALLLSQLAMTTSGWAQIASPTPESGSCGPDVTPEDAGFEKIEGISREETTLAQFVVPGQRNMLSGRSKLCVEAHDPTVEIILNQEGQVMLSVLEGSVTLELIAACGMPECDQAAWTNPMNGELRIGMLGEGNAYVWTEIAAGRQVLLMRPDPDEVEPSKVASMSDVTVKLTFGNELTRLVTAGWLPLPQGGGCAAACWHFP